MIMFDINDMVVTNIEPPVVVYSKKGRVFQMENRPWFGLSFCTCGQISYKMNGKTYISNKDSIVILPQNATYTLYGDKEGIFPLINFNCENFYCHDILVIPVKNLPPYLRAFENINNLFLHNKSKLKIYSAFYNLLDEVFALDSQIHPLLQKAVEFIEKNIGDTELSNSTLAKSVNISEVYLRKLFLKYYDTTPKQYILEVRVRKAKQLLEENRISVTAISQECGFSSVYHFCRAFKQKVGISPTEYASSRKPYLI